MNCDTEERPFGSIVSFYNLLTELEILVELLLYHVDVTQTLASIVIENVCVEKESEFEKKRKTTICL
jgi:hypothetical protein